MKNITNFILFGFLILIGCNEQTQSDKIESDLKSKYVTIDIYTPSGWSLTIKQDH